MSSTSIDTERLILRRWRTEDREPFAALNADSEVTEYFPSRLSQSASDEFVDRIEAGFVAHGFGLWALEVKATGQFIGFTGLSVPSFEAAFTPTVEIGWRLARSAWGNGFATEAATASLWRGFSDYQLPEIVSFTAVENRRSRVVMERLGMTHDPGDDFEHPGLAKDHPLSRHVLYRMSADRWLSELPIAGLCPGPFTEYHRGNRSSTLGRGGPKPRSQRICDRGFGSGG